jgi:hypothetical protein
MKLAFIYGKQPSSTLTKIFTGSSCYHVGFTDGVKFWDMHLIRRRRLWSTYAHKQTVLIDTPVPITAEYLDHKLDTDEARYGIIDYLLFGLRPIYHLFGKSTRNVGGLICSEMVADDLNAHGWRYTFKEVPSPADLEFVLGGKKNLIK